MNPDEHRSDPGSAPASGARSGASPENPTCIYLDRSTGKACGKPATHQIVKGGSRHRWYYCAIHADWVRNLAHGRTPEPI